MVTPHPTGCSWARLDRINMATMALPVTTRRIVKDIIMNLVDVPKIGYLT